MSHDAGKDDIEQVFLHLRVVVGDSDDDDPAEENKNTSSQCGERLCGVGRGLPSPLKKASLPRCDARSDEVKAVYPLLPIDGGRDVWKNHRERVRKRERHACAVDMDAYSKIRDSYPGLAPPRSIRVTPMEWLTVCVEKCMLHHRAAGDTAPSVCR